MDHGSGTSGVPALGLSGDFTPLEFLGIAVLGTLLGLVVRAWQKRRVQRR